MTVDVIETRSSDSKPDNIDDAASTHLSPIPRLPVKRSLFGKADNDECMKFLNKELTAMTEEASKRWNFDFLNERPLEGRYKWTSAHTVQSSERIPRAYALSWLHEKSVQVAANNDGSCPLEQNICRSEVEKESRLQTVTVTQPKLTQKTIDGYLKCKKRLSSSDKTDCKSNERHHSSLVEPSKKKLRSSSCCNA